MRRKAKLVRVALEAVDGLDTLWGRARVGLMLSFAYYSGTYVTPEEIAQRSGCSTDTVRRDLKRLLAINRVRETQAGRKLLYQASPPWAARTARLIEQTVEEAKIDT